MISNEELDAITFTRTQGGFNKVIGKYIIRKTFELAQGPNVLDVACGNGSLTKFMTEHYPSVVGVDGSKKKIELARKNAPDAKLYVSMFEDFNIDVTFDSIIMITVLEHVDNPVIFLRKAKELLKPDGEVVIFVPNALGLHRRIGKAMGLIKSHYELSENEIAIGHKRFYDKESLLNDIVASGLKPCEVGGLLLKPLSNRQMESWDAEIVEALYVMAEELPDYSSPIYVRAKSERL